MQYETNLITGECTCPDTLYRDGGSYDLGIAGQSHFCKHFLTGIGEAIGCPGCGGRIVLDKDEVLLQYHCTNAPDCVFSWRNAGIDARMVLAMWREIREEARDYGRAA